LAFVFIAVQFLPSPVEGLFWYNAAMFYTGFFGMALFLIGLVLKYMQREKLRFWVYGLAGLTAFFVGGGNYVTALTAAMVLAVVTGYQFIIAKTRQPEIVLHVDKKAQVRHWRLPLVAFVGVTAALAVSAFAPGNAVRDSYLEGMGAVRAVLFSLYYGVDFIHSYFLFSPLWFGVAALVPLMYRTAKNSGYGFRYPVLAVGIFYGIYAAAFTPFLYTAAAPVPGRVMNVGFYFLLLFVFFAMLYVCGYVARKGYGEWFRRRKYTAQVYMGVCIVLFVAACVVSVHGNRNAVTGVSAVRSILNGEARAFHNENTARREILHHAMNTATDEIIFLPAVTARPYVLFFTDISTSSESWRNIAMAEFYALAGVALQSGTEGRTP
jgi:hypothetical protein